MNAHDPVPAVVIAARRWLGTPYLHQGATRGLGCDCLGLICGLWRELCGDLPQDIPRYSADWSEPQQHEALWQALAWHLPPSPDGPLRAGQVILLRMRTGGVAKHLGVVAATGQAAAFIHAYAGHGVVESPLSLPWQRRIVARFELTKRIL
jgi:NlpC/P60 family putative phage cell wall peptidase